MKHKQKFEEQKKKQEFKAIAKNKITILVLL
jgi:hypothetical protein